MINETKFRVILSIVRAAVLALQMAAMAAGQGNFPSKLDLESAVARAMEHDPQLKAARTESKVASERVKEARSGRMPTVQLNQNFARSNNPVFVFGSLLEQGRFAASNLSLNELNRPHAINNLRSSVSVSVPIFDQWQTRSNVNLAKIEKAGADLQIEAKRQKLIFDVVKIYLGAILADGLLKATKAAERSAKENSRKTQNFVNVGMVAESDALVANVELANVEQQRLEAQNSVVTTRAELNLAVGERPTMMYELAGNLQERYFPVEERSELVRIALHQRPEYKQALLAIKEAREKTHSVRNQKLPRLEAFGNFGYSSPYIANGSSDYTVGLNLSYTIFDPGRRSRTEQAALFEDVVTADKDRLADQITLEVIKADQGYKTACAKIRVSIKSVIQAEEALRILQDRYKSAISTFDAVLRAEAAMLRAEHELLKAKYDYYVSYASVLLATGRLDDVRAFDH